MNKKLFIALAIYGSVDALAYSLGYELSRVYFYTIIVYLLFKIGQEPKSLTQ